MPSRNETKESQFIHTKDMISVLEVLTGHFSVVNDSEERKQRHSVSSYKWTVIDLLHFWYATVFGPN